MYICHTIEENKRPISFVVIGNTAPDKSFSTEHHHHTILVASLPTVVITHHFLSSSLIIILQVFLFFVFFFFWFFFFPYDFLLFVVPHYSPFIHPPKVEYIQPVTSEVPFHLGGHLSLLPSEFAAFNCTYYPSCCLLISDTFMVSAENPNT